MQKLNKLEMLAPAGSPFAAKVAINNGADAIYLGIGELNARASATNFSIEELVETIKLARLFGVRVFAAFNIILKQSEIASVVRQIKKVTDLGVDAVILQDLNLLSALQKSGVKTEFHASTQMGIHNLEGAIVAEKLGFSRVILSRETLLEDIVKIKNATHLEIEFFVHGALCVAFSGNCYFSSLIAGRSGNRGRCMQLCRKTYLLNGQKKYWLSTKDIDLTSNLKMLVDVGVTSFKIEGRMRRPEYVGEAVRVYKKALNNIIGNDEPVSAVDKSNLKIMFNRGDGCSAYVKKNDSGNLIENNHPSHIGLKIGVVEKVNDMQSPPRLSIKYNKGATRLLKGDGVKFMRKGIEVGSSLIFDPCNITFVGSVELGDEARLTNCQGLNQLVLGKRREVELAANVKIEVGKKASFLVSDGELEVFAETDNVVQEAKTMGLVAAKLDFLSKTANENLTISDIVCKVSNNSFVSVGELKAMRNNAFELYRLKKVIANSKQVLSDVGMCEQYGADANLSVLLPLKVAQYFRIDKKSIFCMVASAGDVTQELLNNCDFIVLNPPIFSIEVIECFVVKVKEKAILELPIIARGDDLHIISDIVEHFSGKNCQNPFSAYIINNLWGLEICKNVPIILGRGLNLLNSNLLECLDVKNGHYPIIASIESNKPVSKVINMIYGKQPLMNFVHCPQKVLGFSCGNCDKNKILFKDDKGVEFAIRRYKIKNCYHEFMNALPLDNREVLSYNDCSVMIDLTSENSPTKTLLEILSIPHNDKPHTHGNYKRKLL